MTILKDLSLDEKEVKQTVLNVIEYGSFYDVEKLDPLYSNDMQVIRVTQEGKTVVLTKKNVMQFFESKRSTNTEPLSRDVRFNYIEVKNGMAHIVLTRTMKLFGNSEKSVYSICLVKKNASWIVEKETVVSLT